MHVEVYVDMQKYVCNRADPQDFCQYSLLSHLSDSAYDSMAEKSC